MGQNRAKLTKTSVAKIAPPDSGQSMFWDSEVRGFGLRVTAGGAKSYILQRRVGGKERRVTLGRADVISTEAARRKALTMAADFAQGVDAIADQKAAEARATTLRSAFLSYIDAPKKRGKGDKKKPRTISDIQKAMKHFSDWLDTPVTEITGAMVRDHHAKMMERSPTQANLNHRYLRAALNHVNADDDEPILAFNPVNRLNRLNQWGDVERRVTHIPFDRVGDWVRSVQSDLTGLQNENEIRDAFMFMLLTGCRRGEALGGLGSPALRWDDVSDGKVTFRDTKTRNDFDLPLGPWLANMLEGRRDMSGSEFVFSNKAGRVPVEIRRAKDWIQKATGLSINLHDLRRTFITIAEIKLAIPGPLVRRLTNHVAPKSDAHAGYIQFEEPDLRAAMEKIERAILEEAA